MFFQTLAHAKPRDGQRVLLRIGKYTIHALYYRHRNQFQLLPGQGDGTEIPQENLEWADPIRHMKNCGCGLMVK